MTSNVFRKPGMKFKIAEQLSVREIDNEVFILNRNDSHLHTFNESGAALWKAMGRCDSSDAMVDEIMLQYEVNRDQAEKDVAEFLSDLLTMHLIESL
jgi:hypothetical protein